MGVGLQCGTGVAGSMAGSNIPALFCHPFLTGPALLCGDGSLGAPPVTTPPSGPAPRASFRKSWPSPRSTRDALTAGTTWTWYGAHAHLPCFHLRVGPTVLAFTPHGFIVFPAYCVFSWRRETTTRLLMPMEKRSRTALRSPAPPPSPLGHRFPLSWTAADLVLKGNMTAIEYMTEFSMWAIAASPLVVTTPIMNCTPGQPSPGETCNISLVGATFPCYPPAEAYPPAAPSPHRRFPVGTCRSPAAPSPRVLLANRSAAIPMGPCGRTTAAVAPSTATVAPPSAMSTAMAYTRAPAYRPNAKATLPTCRRRSSSIPRSLPSTKTSPLKVSAQARGASACPCSNPPLPCACRPPHRSWGQPRVGTQPHQRRYCRCAV
jgi:hypothetical protein